MFTLFDHAGIEGVPFANSPRTPEQLAPLRALLPLLGITNTVESFGLRRIQTVGISSTGRPGSPNKNTPYIEDQDFDNPAVTDNGSAAAGEIPPGDSHEGIGHWLIRVGIDTGFGPQTAIGPNSADGDTFNFVETDGSRLWFQGAEAEGFSYAVTDGSSKFTAVGIASSDAGATFTVSDAENGEREVAAGDFLDFPVPVSSFTATASGGSGGSGGAAGESAPAFIAQTFLAFDSETASFDLTAMGEVVDLCTDVVCDDGLACTEDFCDPADGSCATMPGEEGIACESDDNLCTDDLCDDAGTCTHVANTDPCDDGFFCNGADTCSGGSCSAHTGDPCTGGGECMDACNENRDICASAFGTPCTADEDTCTLDVCNGIGECSHPANDDIVCGTTADRLCRVRFGVEETTSTSQIQFNVEFDRERGSLVQLGNEICEPLTTMGNWNFGLDNEAESVFARFSAEAALDTPADLIACTYATISNPVTAEEFTIRNLIPSELGRGVVEAPVPVVVTDIVCAGCGTPVSGGEAPTATDCLGILRAAVGIGGGCDPCICDTSGDGRVLATDALRCLQKAVGRPVELGCGACGVQVEEDE